MPCYHCGGQLAFFLQFIDNELPLPGDVFTLAEYRLLDLRGLARFHPVVKY